MARVGVSLALIVLSLISVFFCLRANPDINPNMSPTADADPERAARARAEDEEQARLRREAEAKFWRRSRAAAPEKGEGATPGPAVGAH